MSRSRIEKDLTSREVNALSKPGKHRVSRGLYLLIGPSGGRSWVHRYMVGGKQREMGLGAFPDVTLAQARAVAREAQAKLAQGGDPLAERREAERMAKAAAAAAAPHTFRQCAELLLEGKEAEWRNPKHRQQWRNTLATYAYPVIGDMPAADVEIEHVLAVLRPIWTTKPETASRLRQRVERVLGYAMTVGHRPRGLNPAAWRGNLDGVLPQPAKVKRTAAGGETPHHPALDWREAPAFLATLRARPETSALALEFAILTAARTGEVLGATWSEIDREAAIWTVPAGRMKGGRAHRVPLSAPALAILDALAPAARGPDSPIFPGMKPGRPLSGMVMLMLLRRMNEAPEGEPPRWRDPRTGEAITAHGFRSSFRDWAGEATNSPREVIEAALAHRLGDAAELAYARADLLAKRRALAEAWARFLTPADGDAVVTLQRRHKAA